MRAWEDFLLTQEKELGKETCNKWLRPLKILKFDACNLYLEASDTFKILWFEEHIRHRAQKYLFNNNNKKIKIHLSLPTSDMKEAIDEKVVQKGVSTTDFHLTFDEINDRCLFDNFIIGDGNILCFKILKEAALEIKPATKNTPSFNPIYLFGRGGSGKTHLLHATCHRMKKNGLKALFVRAETFTEHVVNAIRLGEMQTFRKIYRNIDALLIDDVEVFSKKNATQEEFFHTFNTLHIEGKQIILSSSLSPQDLKFIEPRLISRFEWGIVIPIQKLEREKLKELLILKASQLKFILEEELIEFLLSKFGNNTSSLLRSLEALILRMHLQREKNLNLPLAKKLLLDLIEEEEKALLTPVKIIQSVAEHYGIRIEDILSKSQSRECALPRQIAMYLCRSKLHLPYMKIGDIFARDHSTVMSSVKQMQKELDLKGSTTGSEIHSILKRLD